MLLFGYNSFDHFMQSVNDVNELIVALSSEA